MLLTYPAGSSSACAPPAGTAARSKAAQVKKEENPFRRRTNLKELERQEQEAREARRAARPARQRGMERQREPERRRQEPVMQTGGRTL